MALNEPLLAELQHEAALTRKMLERVPDGAFDYKPHEKSMSMGHLASHIAEIPIWLMTTVDEDGIDFAKGDYKTKEASSNADLLQIYDDALAKGIDSLKNADDERLLGNWYMKNDGELLMDMPRLQVIRGFVLNHMIHHRAQLGVYLRMNDIPVPSTYGPSADEQGM